GVSARRGSRLRGPDRCADEIGRFQLSANLQSLHLERRQHLCDFCLAWMQRTKRLNNMRDDLAFHVAASAGCGRSNDCDDASAERGAENGRLVLREKTTEIAATEQSRNGS